MVRSLAHGRHPGALLRLDQEGQRPGNTWKAARPQAPWATQDTAARLGSLPPDGTGRILSLHDVPFHVSASSSGERCGAGNCTDPTATQNTATGQDTPLSTLDVAPRIAGVLTTVHLPFESRSISARWLGICLPDG